MSIKTQTLPTVKWSVTLYMFVDMVLDVTYTCCSYDKKRARSQLSVLRLLLHFITNAARVLTLLCRLVLHFFDFIILNLC